MKLVVDHLTSELQFALDLHLETGIPMKEVFRASLVFFRDMYMAEKRGEAVAYGAPDTVHRSMTKVTPSDYIEEPDGL